MHCWQVDKEAVSAASICLLRSAAVSGGAMTTANRRHSWHGISAATVLACMWCCTCGASSGRGAAWYLLPVGNGGSLLEEPAASFLSSCL